MTLRAAFRLVARKPTGQSGMETTRPEPISFEEDKRGKTKTDKRDMKPAKPVDKDYVLNDDWWNSMTGHQQTKYIDEHPNSKHAKDAIKQDDGSGSDEDNKSPRELRRQEFDEPAEEVEKKAPAGEAQDIEKFKQYNKETENFNVNPTVKPPKAPPDNPKTAPPTKPPVKRSIQQVKKDKPVEKPDPRKELEKLDQNKPKKKRDIQQVKKPSAQEIKEIPPKAKKAGSKERVEAADSVKKKSKPLAVRVLKDSFSQVKNLGAVYNFMQGHTKPGDYKKIGSLLLTLTGTVALTSAFAASGPVGFLAFMALKHVGGPMLGKLYEKTAKGSVDRLKHTFSDDEDDEAMASLITEAGFQMLANAQQNQEVMEHLVDALSDMVASGDIPQDALDKAQAEIEASSKE